MSGTFIDLRNSLVTTFVFPRNNLVIYSVLSGSLSFLLNRSTISLCIYFVYLRESPICKGEVGVLVYDESLQNLFDKLTRGLSNLCENESLMA